MQTIFAQATARGKAGIAVIRISGPEAAAIGRALVGTLPEAAKASLRIIRGPDGSVLDHALVLWFEAPRSFTGEDVLELHLHGSPATLRAVEAAIAATGLARPAEAGEFTLRALVNDRLDLAQVEGLGDLLDAETEAQRRQAFAVFSGAMGRRATEWRSKLLRAAAILEAAIDFAEEDIPADVVEGLADLLEGLRQDLTAEIDGSMVAERVRDGFVVAILGAPNAGKSTLLNALAGREIAITSSIAGTTRDVLEARLDVRGLPVTFLDTAGIRDAQDEIERLGVERALDRAADADLRIVLETEDWEEPAILAGRVDIKVRAKCDLGFGAGVSGKTGEGIDRLLARVHEILSDRVASVRTAISARQRVGMELARRELEAGLLVLDQGGATEIVAEHLRHALVCLDSLIGRVDVEDVLGEIFARFCIGK